MKIKKARLIRRGPSPGRQRHEATKVLRLPTPASPRSVPLPTPASPRCAAGQMPSYFEQPAPRATRPRAVPTPSQPDGFEDRNGERTQYSAAAGRAVAAVLVGLSGEVAGKVYAIRPGTTSLGRTERADVEFQSDRSISRAHAELVSVDGVILIKRLNPANPLFVNEEVVEGVEELRNLADIRIGQSTLRLLTVDGGG